MQAFDFVKEKWSGITRAQRFSLVAGICVIAALLISGVYWLARDDYQVLFSDLSGQDAGAMVAELDRMKVPYRLSDSGSTILVDRDSVYKTRLKLMAKGLDLHGTVGFEVFNNSDFGTTEFAQKVNYQRAMQGELARTIMGFDEIKYARVHLVLPDSGLFKRQNAKPKASVSLVMKGDNQLEPEQIVGIQRLVAASVPEIQASAVTIVNQHGTAVSRQSVGDESEQDAGDHLDNKKRIEEYMVRKIVTVLDRAIGPGKAIVSVDAQLNYDQSKTTREEVIPLPNTSGQNVGAITHRRDSIQGEESYGDNNVVGNLNHASMMPQSSSSEVEFTHGRKVESVVAATGNVKRLSVGVLVPGVADPVELAKLKEIVTMAVGLDEVRGDAIAVYNTAPQGGITENSAPLQPAGHAADGSRNQPLGTLALGAMLLGGGFSLLLVLVCGKLLFARHGAPRLSAKEREQMLRELAQWAQSEHSREPV